MSRELHVDGCGESGVFDGGGEYPPFVVFDADQQKNIAGPFLTRVEAEVHLGEILGGAPPRLDGERLGKLIDSVDEEVYSDDENRWPPKPCHHVRIERDGHRYTMASGPGHLTPEKSASWVKVYRDINPDLPDGAIYTVNSYPHMDI